MFQTGSQINPALGRIDYTPYMQGAVAGAQSIGQGIASLGQSFASGIEKYQKRQEEKQLTEVLFDRTKSFAEQHPELASALPYDITDKKLFGIGVKAAGGPQAAAALLSGLAQKAQANKEEAAIGLFVATGGVPAGKMGEAFKNNPYLITKALAVKTDNDYKAAQIDALRNNTKLTATEAQLKQQEILAKNLSLILVGKNDAEKADIINQTGINPIVAANALALAEEKTLTREKTQADIAQAKAATALSTARASAAGQATAPSGYRYTTTGNLEPIPGGPIAAEQATAKAGEQIAVESQAFSLQNNLNKINDAVSLIQKGNFSSGFGAGVAGFFGGTSASDLRGILTSLKSSLALDKIIELKKAGKTGSTGLGALNLKELETIQSEVANLDQTQSDEVLLKGLKTIYDKISMATGTLPENYRFTPQPFGQAGMSRNQVNSNSANIKAGYKTQ